MTGNVEYHPIYLSIGNVHNSIRRAHRNAVVPIGFLAIPKSMSSLLFFGYLSLSHNHIDDRKDDNDVAFRKFKRQLYHSSIEMILTSLKAGMKVAVILRCPDGHFRRVIYDLAAYIADYPEQCYLAGIVQGWCPRSVKKTFDDTLLFC